MFSDVTKLFDRNFIVGYFLPSSFFSFFLLWILYAFDLLDASANAIKFLPVVSQELSGGKYQLIALTILSFLLSVVLMLLNTQIYRICEGYTELPKLGWLKPMNHSEIRRFNRLTSSTDMEHKQQASVDFPPEDCLLPTAFGNAIRSFETYPREVYGADGIPIWLRLLAVIPAEQKDAMRVEKSSVDFWMNLWIGSLILSLIHLMLALYEAFCRGNFPILVFPVAFGLSSVFCAREAKEAAIGWGQYVKSSFDVYLPDLQKKLGFSASMTRKQEWDLWDAITHTFIYRDFSVDNTNRSWWDQVANLVRNQAVEDDTIVRYKDGDGK